MQDPKKNLYTFSFKEDLLPFIKKSMFFFLPVIILYGVVEILVSELPTSYKIIGHLLDTESPNFETIVLGSSQMKNGINPKYLDKKTINLSSTSQHHNTDFHILKQTRSRLTNVKTVVLELSYGHCELPHNSEYFWKNNLFYKYYKVNNFGRPTTLIDKLIFNSRPAFFSKLLVNNYIRKNLKNDFNKFGFDEANFGGIFKKKKYDSLILNKIPVKIERRERLNLFEYNVNYFYSMLDYCNNENLNVIICSTPLYYTYRDLRNPNILRRRDSIINIIKEKYPNITFFNLEDDPDFIAKYYKNENHLNPDGAKIFTIKLNEVINSIH